MGFLFPRANISFIRSSVVRTIPAFKQAMYRVQGRPSLFVE